MGNLVAGRDWLEEKYGLRFEVKSQIDTYTTLTLEQLAADLWHQVALAGGPLLSNEKVVAYIPGMKPIDGGHRGMANVIGGQLAAVGDTGAGLMLHEVLHLFGATHTTDPIIIIDRRDPANLFDDELLGNLMNGDASGGLYTSGLWPSNYLSLPTLVQVTARSQMLLPSASSRGSDGRSVDR